MGLLTKQKFSFKFVLIALILAAAFIVSFLNFSQKELPKAKAIGSVTVTGVAVNNSSAKIYFNPVDGAKDYRVYDITNPNNVKYAGLVRLSASSTCPGSSCFSHFVLQADGVTPVFPYQVTGSYPDGGTGGPQVLDVPATNIEWNNLGDDALHTLVVEAVDQLGPAPQNNLYTGLTNTPLFGMGMLGSNKGPTPDGKTSTNGQGPYTNNPQVIAQSQQFIVQANPNIKSIPSTGSATQTFFDSFEQAENNTITQVSRSDCITDAFGNLGQMKYTMNAGTNKAWNIEYRQSDNLDSMPFISSDHFMDMIFDGATPNNSCGSPTHTIYGSMALSPVPNVDMSNGKVLHMTMEVDAHQSNRRWLDFNLAPASDPLQRWDFNGDAINNTNQGLFLELKGGDSGYCTLDIFTGPGGNPATPPTGTAGANGGHGARLWGLPGSSGGGSVLCGGDQFYNPKNLGSNGIGLDNRSRIDFFLSQTHAALFEDGQLIIQSDIPAGSFPWANVPLTAYFTHYLYHSDADINELHNVNLNGQTMCYQENSFWYNNPSLGTPASATVCNAAYPPGYGFPYSDERHWDNMGFETLPSSITSTTDFSSLSSLVQTPVIQAVQFSSGNPPPTVTLTASPTTITSGSPSTLTWSSTNATSCTASGAWSGSKSTSGTQSVSPSTTSTYTLICTGTGGSANASATVTVTTSTPLKGDINLDHIVNSIDWSIMNAHWFTNYAPADLNSDGIVNSIDFSILNANWFKTW